MSLGDPNLIARAAVVGGSDDLSRRVGRPESQNARESSAAGARSAAL
jgi:hypothetical protein